MNPWKILYWAIVALVAISALQCVLMFADGQWGRAGDKLLIVFLLLAYMLPDLRRGIAADALTTDRQPS